MTYKRMIRKVVKEANKKPLDTLKRISKDRSLDHTEFDRFKPNKNKEK